MSDLPVPARETDLLLLLHAHDVDTSAWGTGAAKTVAQLHGELTRGECRLVAGPDGLTRIVDGAQVRLRCAHMTLVEDHQRYTDGRPDPVRRRDLQASVGEKLHTGEDPADGARRALNEELGLNGPLTLTGPELQRKTADSQSYPGLRSEFHTVTYDADLPEPLVDWAGYVEVQDDKTSVWRWTPTADAPF